ncbi:glycosyltransferase [Kaistella polysaccharea]|uniref:glycosyltransferase n=1 Tax=Kaistella polysaccharea TaxID=2878534 RepID=UPI001CF4D21A|nr:glycosyltransferase [Kaistella polysaccharea]
MELPLVSVICACYNQSQFIIEGLESVKNQTYKNLEIIIWDDASKDKSVSIIEKWIEENSNLNIRFIRNVENLGLCKSLNNAYSYATGKYLQILALDDILLSDKIERHVSILECSGDLDALVFSDAYLINDESEYYQNKFIAYHKKYLSVNSENFYQELLEANFIPTMSILYKKSIFEQVGLWDENLIYEDYDMMLRISKEYNFIFDETPAVKYRIHAKNSHKSLVKKMGESTFALKLKHIGINENVDKFLKEYIIQKYLTFELNGEQDRYFNFVPVANIRDKWISKNKNQFFYKLLSLLIRVKNRL